MRRLEVPAQLPGRRVERKQAIGEEIVADPIGAVTERWKRPNGMIIERVRVFREKWGFSLQRTQNVS